MKEPFIQIGASKASVEALSASIIKILNQRVDQETMRFAIKALTDGVAVNNTSFVSCNFENSK